MLCTFLCSFSTGLLLKIRFGLSARSHLNSHWFGWQGLSSNIQEISFLDFYSLLCHYKHLYINDLSSWFFSKVAGCGCSSRWAFIWVFLGTDRRGRVCVLRLLGVASILTGRCGFTKSSLCTYRNDEAFTDLQTTLICYLEWCFCLN